MLDIAVDERGKQDSPQSLQGARIDSKSVEIKSEPDLKPEHHPDQQYKQQWVPNDAGCKYEGVFLLQSR